MARIWHDDHELRRLTSSRCASNHCSTSLRLKARVAADLVVRRGLPRLIHRYSVASGIFKSAATPSVVKISSRSLNARAVVAIDPVAVEIVFERRQSIDGQDPSRCRGASSAPRIWIRVRRTPGPAPHPSEKTWIWRPISTSACGSVSSRWGARWRAGRRSLHRGSPSETRLPSSDLLLRR